MSCPHCGAPIDSTVTRDGVIVHTDPLRVNYRGRRLELTRSQAEIMAKLVRFGRASFEALQGDRSLESLRYLVQSLRKRLPQSIRVETVYGWGYTLNVSDNAC
jgi:DNA-binding response OmpR family regulator